MRVVAVRMVADHHLLVVLILVRVVVVVVVLAVVVIALAVVVLALVVRMLPTARCDRRAAEGACGDEAENREPESRRKAKAEGRARGTRGRDAPEQVRWIRGSPRPAT